MTTSDSSTPELSNSNVIEYRVAGSGRIGSLERLLADAGLEASYLDASIITVHDFYLPMPDAETRKVRNVVSNHILKAEVLILDLVERASVDVLKVIGDLMETRTVGDVEVPNLSAIYIFVNGDSDRTSYVVQELMKKGATAVVRG